MHMKDFMGWAAYQSSLEESPRPKKEALPGQVWRVAIGINTGHEIDGRSKRYWRPVVILRITTGRLFVGVPLTSKSQGKPFHVPVVTRSRKGYAVVNQVRAFDLKRLQQYYGRLSEDDMGSIRREILTLFD